MTAARDAVRKECDAEVSQLKAAAAAREEEAAAAAAAATAAAAAAAARAKAAEGREADRQRQCAAAAEEMDKAEAAWAAERSAWGKERAELRTAAAAAVAAGQEAAAAGDDLRRALEAAEERAALFKQRGVSGATDVTEICLQSVTCSPLLVLARPPSCPLFGICTHVFLVFARPNQSNKWTNGLTNPLLHFLPPSLLPSVD